MTQQAMANAMRERGWKWSQATVWSVDTGERPLRLAEAKDLAEVLGVDVTALLYDGATAVEMLVHKADRELGDRHVALAVALDNFLQALRTFKEGVSSAGLPADAWSGKTLGALWLDMTEREVVESLLDNEGFVSIDPGSAGHDG